MRALKEEDQLHSVLKAYIQGTKNAVLVSLASFLVALWNGEENEDY